MLREIRYSEEDSCMEILEKISTALQKRKVKEIKNLVQEAIDAGIPAEKILNDGLIDGMNVIGAKFKNGEIYVPEVMMSAKAMKEGTELLKPLLISDGVEACGIVVIGTVEGDQHDIGKNLVAMMMESKGFEVIDLGTNVTADRFIDAAIERKADFVCCSALLTTTMINMKKVVEKAEEAGVRNNFTIMIGGAPVTEDFAVRIGADIYTPDAGSAAEAAMAVLNQSK